MTGNDNMHSLPAEVRQGPLVGLKVIDVGQMVAGPLAATLLADYGADVIKIEPPGSGDSLRRLAPHKEGVPLWWKVSARNKRSIALDLKREAGRAVLHDLIAVADVLIENYPVGIAQRLGFDYETVKKLNPGIVMLSLSGFGQYGPKSDQRAFGRTAEAYSGMAHVTGYPDRPPAHSGFPVADEVSGVFGALGVVSALYERDRNPTGSGQHIDLALFEVPFRLMEFIPIRYDQLGEVTGRGGTSNEYVAPVGTWPTADGKWASFTGSTEAIVQRLFDAMGKPEFKTDSRFSSNQARVANRAELNEFITNWMSTRTAAEVTTCLESHDVAIAAYLDISDIFQEAHYRERETLVTVDDVDLGPVVMQNVVPKFSRTPGKVRHAGPREVGADGSDVLRDWLGSSYEAVPSRNAR